MKKMKFVFGMMLMSVLSIFTGCSNDDGYSVGDIAADWVTIKMEGDRTYSFVGDAWGSMWSVSIPIPTYNPKNGDRAFLLFNPLSDGYAGYDHAVKPEYIYPVLTKTVEEMNHGNEAEYGDDPVRVTDAWIGGGYMNLVFYQKVPSSKPHRVSLVKNMDESYEDDGYIHLEYRYKTYGDSLTNVVVSGAVSYNLNTLELEGKKGVKMRINSAVNGERILIFDAKENNAPLEGKKFDLSKSANVK